MFNIKNIVNKITDRGRESNPNSPGRGPHDDDEQRTEGFLCPKCMKAFASAHELQLHYVSLHGEDTVLDTPGASVAGFYSLHQEVGERYKLPQEASSGTSGPGISVSLEEVSGIRDVAELQKILQEVLENMAGLQSEKDHLEQRAAQLAQMNVTLKAACDEGESSQAGLKERLKVVEAQLAHRESIDDAAVLRQELVQVQRVMDELNREREQERDALRAELQQLQSERSGEVMADVKDGVVEKETEIVQLKLELEASQKQILELTAKYKEDDVKMESVNEELNNLRQKLACVIDDSDKEKEALRSELQIVSKERDSLKLSLCEIEKEREEFKSSSCRDIEDLRTKLETVTLANQHVDEKLQTAQNEVNIIKKERENLKTELIQKTQLSEELERMKCSCEEKIQELNSIVTKSKQKIAHMESEHAELVAQIQVGEGATTAIQQLTQENSSLQLKLKEEIEQSAKNREDSLRSMQDLTKQLRDSEEAKKKLQVNLETEQSQFRHMKVIMDEMIAECRGLKEQLKTKDADQEELRRANESLKSTIQVHKTTYADLEEEMKEKSIEIFQLTEKIRFLEKKSGELQADVSRLETVNSQLSTDFDRNNCKIQQLTVMLNSSEEANESLRVECFGLNARNVKLADEVSALTDKLKATENQLQIVGVQRASLETSFFEVQKYMAELEREKKDLEEDKVKEISALRDMVQAKSEQIEKHEEVINILKSERLEIIEHLDSFDRTHQEEMREAKGRCDQLSTELAASMKCRENIETNLSTQIQKRMYLEGELEKLQVKLDTTVQNNIAKEKSLQASLDEVSGEKLALEVQLEASNAERQALLERCYASASETETLHRTIADLRRKLDESQAALHELGRENQTLQLDIDKLIGRKWAEDSEVNKCTLCHRDFSLILRKHHCRNCGQIFCNECSSKTAPIASNKKPVRVCDGCYGELTPK